MSDWKSFPESVISLRRDTATGGRITCEPVHVPGYEKVIHFTDPERKLDAIIAIHSTVAGPAMGGCRIHPFANFKAALDDVLRLSKGMTYKNILAGVAVGGGKAVIIADPKKDKTPALFDAFAEALNSLEGTFITAEDVGSTPDDMNEIAKHSTYVAGGVDKIHGSGDPSPFTAYGVYAGMRAALSFKLKQYDLKDVRICVLGLGHVGFELCRLLHAAGARLTVADIDAEKVERARTEFGATVIAPENAHKAPVDILAPCALGSAINEQTVDEIKAQIVAGSANNQLSSPDMGDRLHARNILYAPDFVINAGGIIRVTMERAGNWNSEAAKKRVAAIENRLLELFHRAEREHLPTHLVADRIAAQLLEEARSRAVYAQPA